MGYRVGWEKPVMKEVKTYEVICHVCGKTWRHQSSEIMVDPSDLKGRLVVTCNISEVPPVHTGKEINESWQQMNSGKKALGDKNRVV